MKKLILIATVLFGASFAANAQSCSVELQNQNGRTVDTFYGYGSGRNGNACMNARSECKYEAARRERRTGRRFRCVANRGGGNGGITMCNATMKNRRGMSVDFFSARGVTRRDACSNARMQCERALRRSNRPYAYCEVERGGGNGGGRDRVTKQCTVERVGRLGRVLQSHRSSATGRRGTGVKQRACQQARSQCQLSARRMQTCRRSLF